MNEQMKRCMNHKKKKNMMRKRLSDGDHDAACDTDVGTIAVAGVAVDVVTAVVGVDILDVCNVVVACCFALRCNFCCNNFLLVAPEFH